MHQQDGVGVFWSYIHAMYTDVGAINVLDSGICGGKVIIQKLFELTVRCTQNFHHEAVFSRCQMDKLNITNTTIINGTAAVPAGAVPAVITGL